MRAAFLLTISVVVLVICTIENSGVDAGCPENCWTSKHFGSCNSRTNTCQCAAGHTGPQCAYSNNTNCVEGMCSRGFNGQDGTDITLYYPMITAPPFQDCEHMRVKIHSSGTDTTDLSDDTVIADYLVDLKSLGGDEVDPYCFAWTRDPDLTDVSARFCVHITEGDKQTIDEDIYYSGRMWVTITGIDGTFNLIDSFQYHQPARCTLDDCNVSYNDDLSSFDWTTVNIRSTAPFVAITPVSYTAARLALLFHQQPPTGLSVQWALNCQPTAADSSNVVVANASALEWVVFDACGLAAQDSLIYLAFTCARPPCSFRVAERFAYVETFGEDQPVSVSGAQIAIFEPDVYLRTQKISYNVTIEAIYPVAVDLFDPTFPFPEIHYRINYCPTPGSTPQAISPQVIDGQTALYQFPATLFQSYRSYYFRAELPSRCEQAKYAYTCSNVVFNTYLTRVIAPSSDDNDDTNDTGGFPVFLIILLVLFVVAVIVAVGVFAFRHYRDRRANPVSQGYSNDFPDVDESEVDEVVVAENTEGQNSFGISTNSAFSL